MFTDVIALRIELRLLYSSSIVMVARYASDTCIRLEAFENQDSSTVAYSTWYCRRNTLIHEFSIVIVLRIELRLFYLSRTVVVARCASDTCIPFEAFGNQHSTTVAYLTWYHTRNTALQVFTDVIVLRIEMRLLYSSSIVMVARYASDTCIRLEAFENQDSSTVAYSTWYCRRNTLIQEFSEVIVLRIELRLFYLSRTVVVARCASDTCIRLEAFENQDSSTVAYSTWYCRRNTLIEQFFIVIVLRIELRLFYLSRTVVVTRCASDTCIRFEAFGNQHSTTVAFLTWYHTRNTALQVFTDVIVLRIEMRLLYSSSIVMVARYASDTCIRLEAFENQDSSTVAYSTWYCRRNTLIQEFSEVIVLRIELRLFYLSRTVVVARCASDTCIRLEAFENQDSSTVAYSTWYCRRNTLIQQFFIVIVLRIELRLFYLSRTVVVARCASDTCIRFEAFGNQHSTTVAFLTWYYTRNTAIQVFTDGFSAEIVLRIELRLLYISRSVVVARYASDTCIRLEAFGKQHSTTVDNSTWYNTRTTSIQEFSIVMVLKIELRLLYPSRTVVAARYVPETCIRLEALGNQHSTTVAYYTCIVMVARYASDTCIRLEAFENQDSSTVAYTTWYCRRNTLIHEFSIVIVLRIELRLFYLSRTVVVARCASDTCIRLEAFENQDSSTVAYSTCIVVVARYASDTCIRLEAFENQDSSTVAYSTWYCRRNSSIQVFSIVILQRIELRLLYHSRTLVAAKYVSDPRFRLVAFENQHSTTVAYSTWYCRRNTLIQQFSIVIVLRIELRLFYISRPVVVARCASDTCIPFEAFGNQHSTTVAYLTWYHTRNTALQVFTDVIVLRIELRLLYSSSIVMVARYASDTRIRLEAFENQDSSTVAYSTWYCRRNTLIQEFSEVIVLRIELRLFYLSRTVVVARCASDTCIRLVAFENQQTTTVAYLTWYNTRNTALQGFSAEIVLRIELRLLYISRSVVVARYASDTCIRLEAFGKQHSTTVDNSTWYNTRTTSIQEFSIVMVLKIELRLLYPSRTVVAARYVPETCIRLEALGNQHSTTVAY
ncbi:hypothetical protein ANTQUA_LOCUS10084 [Anthophora quadrimaculata]